MILFKTAGTQGKLPLSAGTLEYMLLIRRSNNGFVDVDKLEDDEDKHYFSFSLVSFSPGYF